MYERVTKRNPVLTHQIVLTTLWVEFEPMSDNKQSIDHSYDL